MCGLWARINDVYQLFYKFVLRNIPYNKQAYLFDKLAKYYNATKIAIDAGGAGKSIVQELEDTDRYPDKAYAILPVMFSGTVTVGEDRDGRPLKARIKTYSTLRLQTMFSEKKLLIPQSDYELIDELQQHTQMRSSSGNYLYYGKDHNIDMMRCLAIMDYLQPTDESKSNIFIGSVSI